MKINTKKIISILLIGILIFTLTACGGKTGDSDKPTESGLKVGNNDDNTPSDSGVYKIGDTLNIEDKYEVVISNVYQIKDEYAESKEVENLLVMEYSIKNNTDEAISPLMDVVLIPYYSDGTDLEIGINFDERFITDDPFGEIEAGQTMSKIYDSYIYTPGKDVKVTVKKFLSEKDYFVNVPASDIQVLDNSDESGSTGDENPSATSGNNDVTGNPYNAPASFEIADHVISDVVQPMYNQDGLKVDLTSIELSIEKDGLLAYLELSNYTDIDYEFDFLDIYVNGIVFEQWGEGVLIGAGETIDGIIKIASFDNLDAIGFKKISNVLVNGMFYAEGHDSIFTDMVEGFDSEVADEDTEVTMNGSFVVLDENGEYVFFIDNVNPRISTYGDFELYSLAGNDSDDTVIMNIDITIHADKDYNVSNYQYLYSGEPAMIPFYTDEEVDISSYSGITINSITVIDYEDNVLASAENIEFNASEYN